MSQTALGLLLAWPVIALLFFAALGPWRGVIATYVAGYLVLSGRVGIEFSGIPNYTKFTALGLGAAAGILIFDARRLLAFRPRWYDGLAPALCLIPFASFAANGLPIWGAVSACSNLVFTWVIPYFAGRLYAGRPGADRELALGLTLAGALMMPVIAFEVASARSVSGLLYGIELSNGYKYGFYRPVVMANNSLELGLWSTLAALPGVALWVSRAVPRLLGLPLGLWVSAAVAGAVICLETAALGFLGMGVILIAMTVGRRRFGPLPELAAAGAVVAGVLPKLGVRITLMLLGVIAAGRYMRDHRPRLMLTLVALAAPFYLTLRVFRLVSPKQLTIPIYTLAGPSRGLSFDFRIRMEEAMVRHAMNHLPLLGWATLEGGRAYAPGVRILDSMWIIYMATSGILGLVALYGMLCLPLLLIARRRPPDTWEDPRNAAIAGLTVALIFYIFDSLLNAYRMAPVPIVAGLLMGMPAMMARARALAEAAADRGLERVERLAASGRVAEAERECRRLVAVRSAEAGGAAGLADARDRLADLLEATGRPQDAESERRRALGLRVALASSAPGDPGARAALAGCAERLARNLAARGRPAEAAEARGLALEQRAALAAAFPDDPGAMACYGDGLNDLAWLLSAGDAPGGGDPGRAVALAERAVRLRPGCKSYWNTLGAAYLRAGDPEAALAALGRSLRLGPDESGFDEVLRAAALAALGDEAGAREALGRVDAMLGDGRGAPASLLRLRAEAAEALRGGAGVGAP